MTDNHEDREMNVAEDIEMMLPWYVTGTLSEDERARVDRYIADHPEMARQLDLVREELDASIALNEEINPAHSGALDRLLTRIDAEDGPERTTQGSSILDWLTGWLPAFETPTLRLATVGAAIVIVAQAVIIGSMMTSTAPTTGGYETASGPTEVADDSGTRLLVAFSEKATAEQITSLLDEIDASIISGPRAGGFFEIRIEGSDLTADKADALVSDLEKRSAIVKFVSVAE